MSRSPAPISRSKIRWWKLMLLIRSSGISTPCFASKPVRKITRSSVTTKCVYCHWTYLINNHTAQITARMAHAHAATVCTLPESARTPMRAMTSGIPVRMCFEKNHQCGWRSSATVSPSLMRCRG
jgi:hypothetical protein